jgi:TetR/AcrR family transcriptional regulator, regulator of cefoperazone and chloramphenicol sensitivity
MAQRNSTRPVRPQRQTSKSRASVQATQARGDETRERILTAALAAFGNEAFLAVTTRQIAAAAAVSLPTLQYYFGDKEGIYRACAEVIVERYRSHTSAAATRARESLRVDRSPATARAQLKALMAALADFLIGSTETSGWSQFVSRELRDPGPAFEILYANLWRPGVEVTTRLIARIVGCAESDPAARVRALLLISSVLAFQSGRSIAMRSMEWSSIGPKELAMVQSGIAAQIDALGSERS